MSDPGEDELSSRRVRSLSTSTPDGSLAPAGAAVTTLSSLLDRFAMLRQPALASALGITQPGHAQERTAEQIFLLCTRVPQTVSRLPADRLAVLKSMFPGPSHYQDSASIKPLAGTKSQRFRRAVEDLADAMNRVPNPSTATDRAERARLARALGNFSPVPPAFIAALPPAHAGLVRHLVHHSPPPASPASTGTTASRPSLRAVGDRRPGTPGSRRLPPGSHQDSRRRQP